MQEIKENKLAKRDKMASYYLDLSKLSFAGLVIGGLMSIDLNDMSYATIYMVFFGIITTYVFQKIGKNLYK